MLLKHFGRREKHTTFVAIGALTCLRVNALKYLDTVTVLPAMSESDVMFCLQSYQGLIIDRSLMY